MTSTTTTTPPQKRVCVWFADTAICTHVAEPERAREYARAIGRRFFGLQVTIDDAPVQPQECGKPLPANSALWPLTVK
ncbi:MAG: hypothetical protein ACRDO7_09260 [Nocardioidaceae bacterium]